jgi:DivIVA domain-containing protein
MELFIAIIAVLVLGLAAVAASGRLGQFGPAQTDRPEPEWPRRALASADVEQLRFAVVPRGYAMDQVDRFCDLVRTRLAQWEEEFGPLPGTEDVQPGIMVPDRISNQGEVTTDHGSDEAQNR